MSTGPHEQGKSSWRLFLHRTGVNPQAQVRKNGEGALSSAELGHSSESLDCCGFLVLRGALRRFADDTQRKEKSIRLKPRLWLGCI